jgi:hypothetical protein
LASTRFADSKRLLRLAQLGLGLVALLACGVVLGLRDGVGWEQLGGPVEVADCEDEGGLGLLNRGLELLQLLGPRPDLHRLQLRLGPGQLAFRVEQIDLEIGRIDLGQKIVFLDRVADLDRQGHQGSGDAKRHGHFHGRNRPPGERACR